MACLQQSKKYIRERHLIELLDHVRRNAAALILNRHGHISACDEKGERNRPRLHPRPLNRFGGIDDRFMHRQHKQFRITDRKQ
ncbi:hypothetical protein AP057_12395 [Geobacillus sp. Sah69]|nr:hypothetical protein [Geobacillus sp. Sah69]KQC46896.1 hypothetical protein AP057_12395 [Geobacillus sp. Sah69]